MYFGSVSNVETISARSVIQALFSRSMKVLAPVAYFPPVSYFAWLVQRGMIIETKEHYVKQSLRNRCTIMGSNGPLNLLVPRTKTAEKQLMEDSLIHNETDWKRLHWRSLEAAYRKSPFFEYYEDDLRPFFETEHTHHLHLGIQSIALMCSLLEFEFEQELTSEYVTHPEIPNLRNAWNKQDYAMKSPVTEFPEYIQVFQDRFPFSADMSVLDLLFCLGPQAAEYINNLPLSDY